MTTVTIPKEFSKTAQLVAVPLFVYEEYAAIRQKIKSAKTFRASASERRLLARGRANFRKGNFVYLKDL